VRTLVAPSDFQQFRDQLPESEADENWRKLFGVVDVGDWSETRDRDRVERVSSRSPVARAMPSDRATVLCADCDLRETYGKLQPARERIDTHRAETGHDPYWELGDLSPGVVQMGDAAGVCGMPDHRDTDAESDPKDRDC